MRYLSPLSAITLAVIALTACGGSDDPAPVEETRTQDSRNSFAPAAPNETTFAAMAAAPGDVVVMSSTSRWKGMLNGAQYQIEVPPNWNGKLVMYAHGYVGQVNTLVPAMPSIRRHLIQQNYAWAASSYSKNYYDVRAGVEDTNALALAFSSIAATNSRPLTAPTKTYIIGHSMGGHIAAAAIEDETFATARNKVRYHGAVPMCGVVGDTELFDYLGAAQVTAQALAGVPRYPTSGWADISALVNSALFTTFPSPAAPQATIGTTAAGLKYKSVLQNLTGGQRPMFDMGLSFGGSFPSAWGSFGGDGTVNGIFNKYSIDTNRFTYVIDGDTTASAALNASAQKLTAAADFNRVRYDGLRWVPKVNGEFKIPVVSIHTLGDLFVPFSMEQIYRRRVEAKGNGGYLVQRAIRGASHCDFTIAEQVNAFADMVNWETNGASAKPAGDDVLTPATVAATTYGCTHTVNTRGPDESVATNGLRPNIVAFAPCP